VILGYSIRVDFIHSGPDWLEEAPVPAYEITVTGPLGPAEAQAFDGLAVDVRPAVTVVSGDLDRRGLQVVLDRIRAMGLELVAIRQKAGR
jgi:hypothetical protein